MTKYEDYRGLIIDFLDGTQSITSNFGAIRARHHHKTSGHIVYLTKGSLEYYERPVGDNGKPTKFIITAPAKFETDKLIDHEMVFTSALSEMYCVRTGGSFTHDEYEADLVRFNYSLKDIYDNWKE